MSFAGASSARGHGGRGDFAAVIRAEWTKFRTVRGWVLGLVLGAGVLVLFAYLTANGQNSGICVPEPGPSGPQHLRCGTGHPLVPVGPGDEAVADSYYLVGRQLAGNGTITARVTHLSGLISSAPANAAPSLARTRPGLAAWSKAGIIISAGTRQGAPYAAVMATPGHGVRFQYDFTHDRAGIPGSVSSTSPRWLKLTRDGETLTAYESADGTHWHRIGSKKIAGLSGTVEAGVFVTSPTTSTGLATRATARFDHVTLDGSTRGGWQGRSIGESHRDFYSVLGTGGYHGSGPGFVISGSGDIAPAITASGDTPAGIVTQALIAALIVVVIVASAFIAGEYRRGLIRTTLSAMPSRGRVLAAKALVLGLVAFTAGALAAMISIPLADHVATTKGNYVFPASVGTEVRVILGTGLILALTAAAVLALGVLLRRTASTVVAGMVIFVLPAMLAVPYVSGGAGSGGEPALPPWLLRASPVAGFSLLGSLPRSSQVSFPYTIGNGYLPLPPGVGFAVLVAWTVGLLLLAARSLSVRDA